MNYPTYNMRQKHKSYDAYKLLSTNHYESIIKKYGMPPKAHPPQIPEDIIEKVLKNNLPTVWRPNRG